MKLTGLGRGTCFLDEEGAPDELDDQQHEEEGAPEAGHTVEEVGGREHQVAHREGGESLLDAEVEEGEVEDDESHDEQQRLPQLREIFERKLQLVVVGLLAVRQGGSVDEARADDQGVPAFLVRHGLEADDAKVDEENAEEDLSDQVALVQAGWEEEYAKIMMPKTMLQRPPMKTVQGTILYGKKWIRTKKRGPRMAEIQADMRMTSMTAKTWYL
jgi:hypothetical protein